MPTSPNCHDNTGEIGLCGDCEGARSGLFGDAGTRFYITIATIATSASQRQQPSREWDHTHGRRESVDDKAKGQLLSPRLHDPTSTHVHIMTCVSPVNGQKASRCLKQSDMPHTDKMTHCRRKQPQR